MMTHDHLDIQHILRIVAHIDYSVVFRKYSKTTLFMDVFTQDLADAIGVPKDKWREFIAEQSTIGNSPIEIWTCQIGSPRAPCGKIIKYGTTIEQAFCRAYDEYKKAMDVPMSFMK